MHQNNTNSYTHTTTRTIAKQTHSPTHYSTILRAALIFYKYKSFCEKKLQKRVTPACGLATQTRTHSSKVLAAQCQEIVNNHNVKTFCHYTLEIYLQQQQEKNLHENDKKNCE